MRCLAILLPSIEERPKHMTQDPIQTPPKPASRGVRILAVVLVCGLALGYVLVHRQRAEASTALEQGSTAHSAQATPVTAIRVSLGNGHGVLRLPGATAAWYESTLYGRVNGYVEHWSADIGDRVHQGQVLASIATPDLDAELAAAKAHLLADQAEVAVRQSAREFAATTYQRWHDSPTGVVAEQERDAKKADLDGAVAQLAAAEARVTLDRAEVSRLDALSAFKQVTAPIDGVVTERRIDIGNLVTAGSTAATTPLYRVVNDATLRVFVDVPQNLADQVNVGSAVTVFPADAAQAPIAAKVTRSSGSVDPQTRTLRVEIDIPNPRRLLTAGQYVQTEFQLHEATLPVVPAAALLFRASGAQVAVVAKDGSVGFRPVTIARDEGSRVTLAGGVEAGDLVALNLSSQVASGDKVDAQVVEMPSTDAGAAPAAAGAGPVGGNH